MLSLGPARSTTSRAAREARAGRRDDLAVTRAAVPDAPNIESQLADGIRLESTRKKLKSNDGDLFVADSPRFAAPKRIFLGSTASRILAGVDVPGDCGAARGLSFVCERALTVVGSAWPLP